MSPFLTLSERCEIWRHIFLEQAQQVSGSMQTKLKSDMMRKNAELEIRELEVEDLKGQLSSAVK